MKHLVVLVPAALLLSGCGLDMMSLHPLYTDDDVILEEALPGRWVHVDKNETETWRFERLEERNAYKLWINDESEPIECHLVRLSNYLFLDASSFDPGDTGIRGHLFMRVEIEGDTLRLSSIEDKWLREKIEKENALAYERVRRGKDTKLVIRASTLDLQAFLMNHATNPRAFAEWTVLSRSAE